MFDDIGDLIDAAADLFDWPERRRPGRVRRFFATRRDRVRRWWRDRRRPTSHLENPVVDLTKKVD
ncbi:hypothetical protein ACT17_15255 [Mycolicibacterium conceptionense]|uniref:Uncharacterized protein n=1 Tax=Mycolicibacterium conceptionense TaxID=451644 RepID=A0A0J8UB85_9MYCO|nr:hypothetical protein [Mycolicibacterium conceptionense]KMV17635.1 hypothetical protein ACT17_15255 [Mycolicibacterium conceptionense]